MRNHRSITIWRPVRAERGSRPSRRSRPVAAGARSSPPPDPFWRLLWSYATVAALGLLVLTVVSAPPPRVVPAMAHLTHGRASSTLSHWLSRIRVPKSAARAWFADGVPLISWVEHRQPEPLAVHWDSLLSAAVGAVTATPLNSLNELLYAAVPTLAATPPGRPLPELPPAARAVNPALPGAHGLVWAVLGSRPEVGLYQTESHQSFWPELPTGTKAAYSTHWAKTVVQVGWWLAQDLHAAGVSVVQSRVDNMRQGLLGSYALSLETARTLLRWWPGIHVLLDIQRSDSASASTVAVVHGTRMARIRFVVGTDQLVADPHWHENLHFAVALAQELRRIAPGILQNDAVDTVPFRYNQQLLPGDLVVEVGGPESTLGEERRAVYELAHALAALIREGRVPR